MLDGTETILRWKIDSKNRAVSGNIQCGTTFVTLIIISEYSITLKNVKYN